MMGFMYGTTSFCFFFLCAAPHFPECMLRWDRSSCTNGHNQEKCVFYISARQEYVHLWGISSRHRLRGKNVEKLDCVLIDG